ncbi:MAG: putative electron transfer flavoprotein FixA [Propionibacteriaceae bacterium]|jgi:electron transfer flavoprotein beta subunit|nr:putative electron transfer flavoprotein FixA [Propionibacteriaceae bacterium]
MRIVACVKACPDTQDITAAPDRTLSFERAQFKVGTYDLNAIEAARALADETGGEAIGLSVGGSALASSKLRKDVLSRGLDAFNVICDDAYSELDSYQSAALLQDALGQLGGYDLVLCGAGSSDVYAQQVGNQLGALLGVPTLNNVHKVSVGSGKAVVERLLESVVQVIEVPLPAVLSLTSASNIPRIPSMKDILAAGKKPVNQLSASAAVPQARVEVKSVLAPEQQSRQLDVYDGDVGAAVAKLASYLKAL